MSATAGIDPPRLLEWLRSELKAYTFDIAALLRERPTGETTWPPSLKSQAELTSLLQNGGYLLPLPTESAALAHLLEVSIIEFFWLMIRACVPRPLHLSFRGQRHCMSLTASIFRQYVQRQ